MPLEVLEAGTEQPVETAAEDPFIHPSILPCPVGSIGMLPWNSYPDVRVDL